MKKDEEIRKIRGKNLKSLLDRCNLHQKDLCRYSTSGLHPSTISNFIKLNGKSYINESNAYTLIDVFSKLKKDFPEKDIIIPTKEYLLGETSYPTKEEAEQQHELDNKNIEPGVYFMLQYSMSELGYSADGDDYFFSDSNKESDLIIDLTKDDPLSFIPEKSITKDEFEEYKNKLLEYSYFLAWQILNKDK